MRHDKCILGIDIGTTNISAVVIDAAQKRILETCVEKNNSQLPTESDFSVCDVGKILHASKHIIDALIQRYPNVAGIGITGQMHGILYVDAKGKAVSPLYTWQDGRGNRAFGQGKTYCDEIKSRTGYTVYTGYGYATLFYNHVNALEPEKATTFCTIIDYVAMQLTGRITSMIHPTNAASFGLYDLEKNRFDAEAVKALQLIHLALPQIAKEGELVGYYRNIPVSVAIGDNQAGFFGSVGEEKGTALVNFGTGSQISVVVDRVQPVAENLELRPYLFGKYLLCGSALCGGRAYALLEKFFSAYVSEIRDTTQSQYAIMNALAQKAYEKGQGLQVSTRFCGTRTEPQLRGEIRDIGEDNFTPENLILGTLQGMVDELKGYFDGMQVTPVTRVVASGNAVQRNPVLQSILADTFQCPVTLAEIQEEAAFGAALYAGKEIAMDWNDFELIFEINGQGKLFSATMREKEVAYCGYSDGTLDVAITYDFFPEAPLHLTGKGKIGDKVRVHLLPYRIELYVNGVLLDEEWPCGSHWLKDSIVTDNGCSFRMQTCEAVNLEEPAVLGVFQNAEGWKPEENVFVGDCMPYSHEGIYHVLYLKDRHRHGSKWGRGAHQWSHISTADFVNWNIHPMAVAVDDPREGSICTGSWIFDGNTHYLYYTVRMCDGSPAEICRSLSEDGYHFKKDKSFSFTLSDTYTAPSARDPKVIKDAEGIYHMFLTTSLRKNNLGCLAHLISKDLVTWQELDTPLYIAPADKGEPECSDYFYKDGYYYLVYSLQGKGYYQYAETPFSDWRVPKDPIIPCENVPKAAVWKDRLIFAGFNGGGRYGGTMTFLEAVVQENGELAYRKLC